MDEHRWKVHGREAIADRLGIRYQIVVGGAAQYIVGGTVANEEILRLAEASERIRELMAENALLRQEKALLIELENVHRQIVAAFAEGRDPESHLFRAVGTLTDSLARHTGAPGKNSDTPADFRSSGE